MRPVQEREIILGDKVYYYPQDNERAKCNFAGIIVADVVKVLGRNLLNIKLRCDGGKDLTMRNISRISVPGEQGVWDYYP